MLHNYFKIAMRALWRNRAHSIINILGLSLGVMCCLLIVLFVRDEWTFDQFHSKADRIFRVYVKEDWGENQQFFNTLTPFPMGPVLKENFPEVEHHVRLVNTTSQVRVGNNMFTETLTVADRTLFEVFDFALLRGDRATALAGQRNIVLSDQAAQKYFGDQDPLNQTLSVQLGEAFEEFVVTGIVQVPTNSSISIFLLIPDHNLTTLFSERALTSAWFNITPETYVLLREGVDPVSLTQKFPSLFRTVLGEEDFKQSKYAPGLQPLTGIHLDPSFPAGLAPVSNPRYGYILAAIALLILVVACINFVTLSVGRSLKRAREVGVRKVVGADRRQLIVQFIGEALIVSLVAMVVGVLLARLNLPLFNEMAGKQLAFSANGFMALVVVALLLVIGFIAGSYPAFVLSAFKPVATLKGAASLGSSKQGLRKVLVGVQLVLSVFLVSSTLVMKNQLDFLRNRDLGFDREQVGVVQLNAPRGGRLPERVKLAFEKAELLKTELAKVPSVLGACASSHDFGNGGWANIGYTDEGGTYRNFYFNTIDTDFIKTLKVEVVQGRAFDEASPSDRGHAILVNEAFVREYGWTDAVGRRIPGKGFVDHEVIGVVKDFNYASLYNRVEPLVLVLDPSIVLSGSENINFENSPIPKLFVRLAAGQMPEGLAAIERIWKETTGGEEFVLSFVDSALDAQYRSDQNLGRIVQVATLLAILIGSLGLYALASLAMQHRIKEISIRKVLGATERSLLVLLTREYVVLLVVCLAISIPLTLYLMQSWLASFEYRIEIGAQVFLLAGGISLLIALLAIGYQTVRTMLAQPAQTLKYE